MYPAPDTSTIKYLILWILEASLHTLRNAFLNMLFREAKEYTKLRLAMKSNANKAKAIVLEPTAGTIRSLQWNAGAGEAPVCEQRQDKDSFDLRILHKNYVPVTFDIKQRYFH